MMKPAWLGVGLLLALSRPVMAFDHGYALLRDSVLAPFAHERGVDFAGLRANPVALERFLAECAEVRFEEYQQFTRAEKMAFLLNLHNAATLKLVCDSRPKESIREAGGFFSSPWTKRFIQLFGRTVGLGQIVHDILRPEFHDGRVHFALYLAARGGPRLSSEPYLAERLEEQLARQAEVFMKERPEINHFTNGVLYLSPLFRWYANDFGKEAGVRAFAQCYFPAVTVQTRIIYTEFDWTLDRGP